METLRPETARPKISGDRPKEDFVFITATGEIVTKVARLTNHSLVAWETDLKTGHEKVDSARFAEDFKRFFNVHLMDIQVTKFHPKDFLVTLANPAIRDAAVDAGHIAVNGRVYAFRSWDVKLHANSAALPYHVRLCLEGLPMHAWDDHTVAQVIGHSCSVHFLEEYSRRTNYTRSFDLWVWCQHLDAIPKTVWLTISNLDTPQAPTDVPLSAAAPYDGVVSNLKLGHSYKVLVHVDKIEDFSFGARTGRPPTQSFNWRFGVPDGEEGRSPRHLPPDCHLKDLHRRRDYDDDNEDRDPPRRFRAKSIWARIGCRDEIATTQTAHKDRSSSKDSGGYRHRNNAINPMQPHQGSQSSATKKANSTPLQMIADVPADNLDNQADSFHAKMDDFIKLVAQALPQPVLSTPPQQLTTFFKQPLSASDIKAIKELVMLGGGSPVIKQRKKDVASSSSQPATAN
ncbi:hypothetical protein ABZP36_010138 [Zizania latifolia]